ncbi:MAG TPA: isochorismatase family cysteine hydrolase [Terriglobia bacterium]|nr:isochorismatase family cysteine hydrolase [Terriglobia bacterium]
MSESIIFFDVDTQVDFMLPSGSLYVKGAKNIIPNLRNLMTYARERHIPVLSSADAHPPDDPSFAQWPPHCVVGTPGQKRIPETLLPNPYVVPNRPGAFTPPDPWPAQVILEKQEYDASTNLNFDAILQALGRPQIILFGVATDYCVRGTALALLRREYSVEIVTDAIKPISEEEGHKAIAEMTAAGARLVKTIEVCT